jgi:hypothetical protein
MSEHKIIGFKPIARKVKGTETILRDDDKRPAASEYVYPKRNFTERQENFYHNLLRLYFLTGSKHFPVYFSDGEGNNWRMDRGCIAMAIYDGFLEELENSEESELETVTLRWVK